MKSIRIFKSNDYVLLGRMNGQLGWGISPARIGLLPRISQFVFRSSVLRSYAVAFYPLNRACLFAYIAGTSATYTLIIPLQGHP